jgi:energy-coupling factor transporter ATP-binding protein EcfA2
VHRGANEELTKSMLSPPPKANESNGPRPIRRWISFRCLLSGAFLLAAAAYLPQLFRHNCITISITHGAVIVDATNTTIRRGTLFSQLVHAMRSIAALSENTVAVAPHHFHPNDFAHFRGVAESDQVSCLEVKATKRQCEVAKWFLAQEFGVNAFCIQPIGIPSRSAYEQATSGGTTATMMVPKLDVVEKTLRILSSGACPVLLDDIDFMLKFRKLQHDHDNFNLYNSTQKKTVGVLGTTGAGKSTFINSLLGSTVLQTSTEICTSAVTKVQHVSLAPDDCEGGECTLIEYKSKTEYHGLVAKYARARDDCKHKVDHAKKNVTDAGPADKDRLAGVVSTYETQERESAVAFDKIKALKNLAGGPGKLIRGIHDNDLKKATMSTDSDGKSNLNGEMVNVVNLFTDLAVLKHITLVDTPGLGDPDKSRDRRSMEAVKGLDGFIFLDDCSGKAKGQMYQHLKEIRAELYLDTNVPAILKGLLVCSKANMVGVHANDNNPCINQTDCWQRRRNSMEKELLNQKNFLLGDSATTEGGYFADWIKRIPFVDQEMGALRARVLAYNSSAPHDEQVAARSTLKEQLETAGQKIRESLSPYRKTSQTMPCIVDCENKRSRKCDDECHWSECKSRCKDLPPRCGGTCELRDGDQLQASLSDLGSKTALSDATKKELLHDILVEASFLPELLQAIATNLHLQQLFEAEALLKQQHWILGAVRSHVDDGAASDSSETRARRKVTLAELKAFYAKHDPPKVAKAAAILRDNTSAELVKSLVKKYGASPLQDQGCRQESHTGAGTGAWWADSFAHETTAEAAKLAQLILHVQQVLQN